MSNYPPPGQPGYSSIPQPGYPPAQPGYPPSQPGYPPPGQPGYPPAGQPVMQQPGAPPAGICLLHPEKNYISLKNIV